MSNNLGVAANRRLRIRFGSLALIAAAVFFVLYPAVRPWEDETTVVGATTAMASTAWVMSHLFGMIGLTLLPIGLLALHYALSGTRAEPLSFVALVTGMLGVGFTLPFFGAETYGLNAIARASAEGEPFDLLAVIDGVRFGVVAVSTFGAGMITVGIAAILAAVAGWRSGTLDRRAGVLFALAFALYVPQFYAPPAARIAHGLLVGLGCAWLARELWRAVASLPPQDHPTRI